MTMIGKLTFISCLVTENTINWSLEESVNVSNDFGI